MDPQTPPSTECSVLMRVEYWPYSKKCTHTATAVIQDEKIAREYEVDYICKEHLDDMLDAWPDATYITVEEDYEPQQVPGNRSRR